MNSPEPIPFAAPDITSAEVDAVVAVLESGWLTTGAEAAAFESEFADQVQAAHAIAVNSATAALHLSLEALGVTEGDLVFVPTYTFAASAEVVRYLGARPVLVDVDPLTANLDPVALRAAIESSSELGTAKVIMPVHIAGVPCEMAEIWALAREFGLAVVEDAAHALPSASEGRPVGWVPEDITGTVCFSFYATKTITTGEGGMATTNDQRLAERMRLMSLHGLSKQAWNRYSGGTWKYDIVAPGFKYNMTDLAAALGRVQLRRSVQMTRRRAEIAERYCAAFADLPEVVLPRVPEQVSTSWHLFLLRLATPAGEPERDALIDGLKAQGIGVSMHFIPLHLHTYYQQKYGYLAEDFPVALDRYRRSLSLPIWSAMTDEQVNRTITAVRSQVRGGA